MHHHKTRTQTFLTLPPRFIPFISLPAKLEDYDDVAEMIQEDKDTNPNNSLVVVMEQDESFDKVITHEDDIDSKEKCDIGIQANVLENYKDVSTSITDMSAYLASYKPEVQSSETGPSTDDNDERRLRKERRRRRKAERQRQAEELRQLNISIASLKSELQKSKVDNSSDNTSMVSRDTLATDITNTSGPVPDSKTGAEQSETDKEQDEVQEGSNSKPEESKTPIESAAQIKQDSAPGEEIEEEDKVVNNENVESDSPTVEPADVGKSKETGKAITDEQPTNTMEEENSEFNITSNQGSVSDINDSTLMLRANLTNPIPIEKILVSPEVEDAETKPAVSTETEDVEAKSRASPEIEDTEAKATVSPEVGDVELKPTENNDTTKRLSASSIDDLPKGEISVLEREGFKKKEVLQNEDDDDDLSMIMRMEENPLDPVGSVEGFDGLIMSPPPSASTPPLEKNVNDSSLSLNEVAPEGQKRNQSPTSEETSQPIVENIVSAADQRTDNTNEDISKSEGKDTKKIGDNDPKCKDVANLEIQLETNRICNNAVYAATLELSKEFSSTPVSSDDTQGVEIVKDVDTLPLQDNLANEAQSNEAEEVSRADLPEPSKDDEQIKVGEKENGDELMHNQKVEAAESEPPVTIVITSEDKEKAGENNGILEDHLNSESENQEKLLDNTEAIQSKSEPKNPELAEVKEVVEEHTNGASDKGLADPEVIKEAKTSEEVNKEEKLSDSGAIDLSNIENQETLASGSSNQAPGEVAPLKTESTAEDSSKTKEHTDNHEDNSKERAPEYFKTLEKSEGPEVPVTEFTNDQSDITQTLKSDLDQTESNVAEDNSEKAVKDEITEKEQGKSGDSGHERLKDEPDGGPSVDVKSPSTLTDSKPANEVDPALGKENTSTSQNTDEAVLPKSITDKGTEEDASSELVKITTESEKTSDTEITKSEYANTDIGETKTNNTETQAETLVEEDVSAKIAADKKTEIHTVTKQEHVAKDPEAETQLESPTDEPRGEVDKKPAELKQAANLNPPQIDLSDSEEGGGNVYDAAEQPPPEAAVGTENKPVTSENGEPINRSTEAPTDPVGGPNPEVTLSEKPSVTDPSSKTVPDSDVVNGHGDHHEKTGATPNGEPVAVGTNKDITMNALNSAGTSNNEKNNGESSSILVENGEQHVPIIKKVPAADNGIKAADLREKMKGKLAIGSNGLPTTPPMGNIMKPTMNNTLKQNNDNNQLIDNRRVEEIDQ